MTYLIQNCKVGVAWGWVSVAGIFVKKLATMVSENLYDCWTELKGLRKARNDGFNYLLTSFVACFQCLSHNVEKHENNCEAT